VSRADVLDRDSLEPSVRGSAFSQPGLIHALTARIGSEARINALYWQGGVCLYEANSASRALLEYQTDSGWSR
jgi:hypothetical protein